MTIGRKVLNNAKKPEGSIGRLMITRMNGGAHKKLAQWSFSHIKPGRDINVLDCGCGGGGNVSRLLELVPEGKVTGIDYSEASVEVSLRLNREAVRLGRCSILQGNVSDLPFESNSFELVTAFETIYFWSEIEKCFSEIYRCMSPGGVFLIANETSGNDPASLKMASMIDGMTVYKKEQIAELLSKAGFKNIHAHSSKDSICITSSK